MAFLINENSKDGTKFLSRQGRDERLRKSPVSGLAGSHERVRLALLQDDKIFSRVQRTPTAAAIYIVASHHL